MWGGSGAGGFGNPPAPAPAFGGGSSSGGFGSPAPAGPSTGGLFGTSTTSSPASAFGSSSGGFGTAPAAPTGGFFGAPAPAPSGGGLFGAPAPAPAAFGGGFGSTAPSTTTTGVGMFGSTTSTTPFGAPAPAGSLFGSPAAAAAAAPAPGLFGQPTTGTTTAFGAPTTTTGGFGTSTTGTTFGAPAPSTTGGGLFGSSSAAPAAPFGAAPAATFGAPSASTGLFGTTAPATTTTTGGFFGSAPATTTIGSPAQQQQQQQAGGTRMTPFQPTSRQDGSSSITLQSITAMPPYQTKSFEELRMEDYMQGNRGSTTPTAGTAATTSGFGGTIGGGGGGFGTTAAAPSASGGLFGNPPAPGSSFGGGGGGGGAGFGAAPAPAAPFGTAPSTGFGFGGGSSSPSPAPGTGLFGSTTTSPTSVFGGGFGSSAPAPTGGLFGAPAPAPSGGGLFGAPAPAPSFGGGFGAPAPAPSGGLFGSTTTAASSAPFGGPAPSTSLFGTTPAPAATGGLFGTTPAPFGGAASSTSSLFGGAPAAPAPGGFASFGGPPATAAAATKPPGTGFFGSPAPASGFGGSFAPSPAATTAPALFGAPPQQPGMPLTSAGTGGFAQMPFYGPVIQPSESEILNQQIRALKKQQEEMNKRSVWKEPSQQNGGSGTPTSQSESRSFGYGIGSSSSPTYSPFLSSPPLSTTKIRPRGFGTTASSTASHIDRMKPLGRDQSALMTPEAYARSSALSLVIKPESITRMTQPRSRRPAFDTGEQQPSDTPQQARSADADRKEAAAAAAGDTSPASPDTPQQAASTTRAEPSRPQTGDMSPRATTTPSVETVHKKLPPTSPAADFYREVVGLAGADDSSRESSPLAAATVVKAGDRSSVPKLTKKGYSVSPSLEDLSRMSDADLATVVEFTVKRDGYGMVKWDGAVDVRGADLDSIVNIEHKDVSVYTVEEARGEKPLEGRKLNRPAQITLFGVFPKKSGAAATPEEKAEFAKTVEKRTQKLGAKFLSYDQTTGQWKFWVPHFSRYNLEEEDDEEGMEQTGGASDLVAQSNVLPLKRKSVADRKATPFKPSRVFEEYEQDNALVSDVEMTDLEKLELAHAIAQDVDRELSVTLEATSIGKSISWESPLAMVQMDASLLDEGFDDADVGSDIPRSFVPEVEAVMKASAGPSICRRLAAEAKVSSSSVDFGLRMGRSFGVGWLPDGSFFKPRAHTAVPSLVKCRAVLSQKTMTEQSVDLLEKTLANSVSRATEDNKCPLFALPTGPETVSRLQCALETFSTASGISLDVKHAFLIIAGLQATESGTVSYRARQMATVLQIFVQVCLAEVQEDIETSNMRNDSLSSIFAALSGGNHEQACRLAAESNRSQLSVALATGKEGQVDIRKQLGRIAEAGALSRVSPNLLRVLKAVAGDAEFENRLFKQGASALDWRRRVALRIWQGIHEDLGQLIKCYEHDFSTGDVPFPSPRYVSQQREPPEKVQDFVYLLLKLFANEGTDAVEVLCPKGFTEFSHDFSMPFHLGSAVCAAKASASMSPFHAEYIANSFAAQLIAEGYWEWSVFVTLFVTVEIPYELKKSKVDRAKSIVFRYYDEGYEGDRAARVFLEEKAGIPSSWFSEAVAFRSVCRHDLESFVNQAIVFHKEAALKLMEEKYLPSILFGTTSDDDGTDSLAILKRVADGFPDSVAPVLVRCVELEQSCSLASEYNMDDDSLKVFQEEISQVEQGLLSYRDSLGSSKSPFSFLFPIDPSPKTWAAIVSATLEKVKTMQFEMKALACRRRDALR